MTMIMVCLNLNFASGIYVPRSGFGGFQVLPILLSMTSIDTLAADYRAITEACGLLDRSERGKLALSGTEAAAFLQGQVTNDVEGLAPGAGCYAAFLTPKGKMLGDVRILNAGDELLLDTERVALQPLFNMIRHFSLGYQVELHKRTLERGMLSLIGPEAVALTGAGELASAPEHAHAVLAVPGAGLSARAIRTDAGVDLLCDAADGEALRAALEEAGAVPVGEAAAECLRVERGRPRYGIDLDDTVIPQEAGLNERAVSFTKGCYVGQETVARLFYRGKPNRQLRGLALSGPAQDGDELQLDGRVVGRITSVAQSPRFGAIALAFVRREAPVGATVSVGAGGELTAEVIELPFR
jgi:tRNA-modifying protein YgfZ